ncbi:DUF6385 domain-containing protein [Clostridium sp. AL.422]|uniref:DUF6385 domain-containing protein n=1 Tax=Clostridium TaxID=1485 RepID=UPI00293DE61F|nr:MULTISPECIES: DUF6385 domain-containing protein [unclassified Clostridium]MDV4152690.1 DUF6385 domain-containing protein [Clostridium sp. AL.422]
MNNLIFNTTAYELRTSIYAQAPNNSLRILQVNSDGSLKTSISNDSLTVSVNNPITIANSITISNASLSVDVNNPITISNPITIANASLTVNVNDPINIANHSLTVSVSNPITLANSITVANDSLTVSVNNPITISNSITIANASLSVDVTNPITIANSSLSVTILSNTFTSSSILNTTVTGTGTILNNTDISTLRTASFLVYNLGTTDLRISLQISPTTDESLYITDPSYNNLTILAGQSRIIPIGKFAHYARLLYILDEVTATFSAYFNGQS